MFDTSNPVEIKITLGMIQDEGVIDALSKLFAAMGKAQEKINARLENEMRSMGTPTPGLMPFRKS